MQADVHAMLGTLPLSWWLDVLWDQDGDIGEEVREGGAVWYPTVGDILADEAAGASMEYVTACGIMAALSPNKPFARNLWETREWIRGRKPGFIGIQLDKVERILGGEHPDSVLSGPKERPFFWCLVDPDHDEAVIDTWMPEVWRKAIVEEAERRGIPADWSWKKAKKYLRESPVVRPMLQEAIRLYSEAKGVSVAEGQATWWIHVRGGAY